VDAGPNPPAVEPAVRSFRAAARKATVRRSHNRVLELPTLKPAGPDFNTATGLGRAVPQPNRSRVEPVRYGFSCHRPAPFRTIQHRWRYYYASVDCHKRRLSE